VDLLDRALGRTALVRASQDLRTVTQQPAPTVVHDDLGILLEKLAHEEEARDEVGKVLGYLRLVETLLDKLVYDRKLRSYNHIYSLCQLYHLII